MYALFAFVGTACMDVGYSKRWTQFDFTSFGTYVSVFGSVLDTIDIVVLKAFSKWNSVEKKMKIK